MDEAGKPKLYRDMNGAERAAYRVKNGGAQSGLAPTAVAEVEPTAPSPVIDLTTPDIPEEERSDDDGRALSDLQRIALELGRAAGDSVEEARAADHIFGLLNGLTKGAQTRLFANPAVQKLFQIAVEKEKIGSPDDPPGTIYYRTLNGEKIPWTKKPWTWSDLYRPPAPRQPMATKTWVPERRMNVGFNGLMVTLRPRREVTLPEVFYGEYMNGLHQEELAEQHAAYMFAESDKQPEDRGMMTTGTSNARSTSMRGVHKGQSQNVYVPGGGFVAGEPGNAQNAAQLDE